MITYTKLWGVDVRITGVDSTYYLVESISFDSPCLTLMVTKSQLFTATKKAIDYLTKHSKRSA